MDKCRIDTLDTTSPVLLEASVTLIVNAFADPERYGVTRVTQELRGHDPAFYRRFFVALDAGEIIAIGGVKAADWASRTHILYLSAVAPERRGKGLGRALIKARIDWLEASFPHGRIIVSSSRAKRFRDFGFSEVRNSTVDGRHLLIRRF